MTPTTYVGPPVPGTPMIRVQDVTYDYDTGRGGKVRALDNVSLSISKGEYVAVVGRNGSGKSTLAKHLNALLLPASGRVLVKEMETADPASLWAIRRTVGMVFQNPDNQIVATTVEEDVAFGPENLGVEPREIRERVSEALSVVDMADYRVHAPHQLSGGQKQRVAIAGVIAMRPECIVLDEPTAMLDPAGRLEVLRTVRRLNEEEGITVVYITHFMNEVVQADRVIVMGDGRIELEGTPRQVFSQVNGLKALDLDVPQITEVAYMLRQGGLDFPSDVLTVDEMVAEVCSRLARRGWPCRSEPKSSTTSI